MRVRYLALSALLAAASGLGAGAHPQPRPAFPLETIPALLDAFRTYRVVSFPGGHTDGNESHIVDAILYAGPQSGRTTAPVSPALCADPACIKMRLDRIALIGLPPGKADRLKRQCQVK